MKALILNSGLGKRMGELSGEHPKCMTQVLPTDVILSHQLKAIAAAGIREVVITTGPFGDVIANYCKTLNLPLHYTFVKNERYAETNYIYSIYCAREHLDDDILLLHGDLVFEDTVLTRLLEQPHSCMVVSSTRPLPDKDFKAEVANGRIAKIGIDFFSDAMAAQPLYYLARKDWSCWLAQIEAYCRSGNVNCYAENAFNDISGQCELYTLDIKNDLCGEIDTPQDLELIREKLAEVKQRTVYMCFSTDIVHSGHIRIIKRAARLGRLIIGVLSDQAISSYKRFPMVPFDERKALFENIADVFEVVEQRELSYKENLKRLKPDYVVHGDDWKTGFQRPIRDEVTSVLAEYGGTLVEFPHAKDSKYLEIEQHIKKHQASPDIRRGKLRRLLALKPVVTALETHNGITGLITETTTIYQDGKAQQFDAMWISSLCDSTAKGKPDIELVDISSRVQTINDVLEVTTKPIIFDGDTGGLVEHFRYNIKTLERIGVSAVIIEDKTGLKKNSLFGTEVEQTQDTIDNFCEKIAIGKKAQLTTDFMIIARVESLILEQGMEDALNRAFAYVRAGADGIMIHSRRKEPAEIFEFLQLFRARNSHTPVVVVPSSFNSVYEEEFAERGANIVIYANQLSRSGIPAMRKTAEEILRNHRAKEADEHYCMSLKEILSIIPPEE